MRAAITADIIGSRKLADRAGAQREIVAVLVGVGAALALPPLVPTIGDEFQRSYRTLDHALVMTLLVSLALPDGVRLRFGIGLGTATDDVEDSAPGDGPAWWAARDAVNRLHRMQKRSAPHARTWIVAAPGQDDPMPPVTLANVYLLARDEIVSGMNARARRLTYGRCLGATQAELAESEGITQPAVSQLLSTAGAAAVVEGFTALRGGWA